jgi:aminopeptidase N
MMKNYRLLLILAIIPACNLPKSERFGEAGVSTELATYRKALISNIVYNLSFDIPADQQEPITGTAKIEFTIKKAGRRTLLLDFNAPPDHLGEVRANGAIINTSVEQGHIAITKAQLKEGINTIEISFRAGEQSLNRNPEYLYTLFVPDRASTAFPCFDQPDMKARYILTLTMPDEWVAISNSQAVSERSADGIRQINYRESEPVSTYLFAFAAGKFERIVKTINGIEMEMLHREPQKQVVDRNCEEIFRLHYNSIKWMEEYSGISYPFKKFGFVLIPSFQYGGMEHPGAIYYRASSLFLEESPTINEQMSRASLIAHETSHIWFGDLVTMKWFDDVWLKEVFAGYMSDKMVNPDFPQANHELRFLLSRYPAAYAVDRTQGANPIIQELDNLNSAGSLYGGIIYNKAPIVMKHLEQMTGDSLLRESLRIYLKRFSFDNAEWDDLIAIIEEISGLELKKWSNAWVREAGMPEIKAVTEKRKDGYRTGFSERDPRRQNRTWPQSLNTLVITSKGKFPGRVIPGDASSVIQTDSAPLCIIPDTLGVAYGYFELDNSTIKYFTENNAFADNPLLRGVMWLNLNENVLSGKIKAEKMYSALLNSVVSETNDLLENYLSGRVSSLFWSHLDAKERSSWAARTEKSILDKMMSVTDNGKKRAWFNLYRNIATTPEGLEKLYSVWQSGFIESGLKLSEDDMCTLSLVLLLKQHPAHEKVIQRQLSQITSNDRRLKYQFVLPAVSPIEEVRDQFFNSLASAGNREKEPWVLEALGYLHHPLRASQSVKYIRPSLELLEEIKVTGDIFFPGNWISTTLAGHSSIEAYREVEAFLDEKNDYPDDLKLKILQAADHLYRHSEKR